MNENIVGTIAYAVIAVALIAYFAFSNWLDHKERTKK